LKRGPNETIPDFSARFLKIYESIPTNFKPPPGASQLHYSEAFEGEFVLALRERRSPTLVDMMTVAIEVEVNVMATRKSKQDEKKVKEKDQPSSSSSPSDLKFDIMMKTMENMMEKFFVDNKPPP